ncbi:MAG TPA: TetR/AcrR family transcriptional regulator [Gemmatimonadales bacterium]|nr:TetR/AcrR family transcriptional regulator [Gemmatimonadales bacterium]
MSENSTPARRRLAPEARRAELLEAAFQVFTELGFGRATLQDVADRAGVTKGALYHYFASKEELFLALVRDRLGPPPGVCEPPPCPIEGTREEILTALVERLWSHFRQPGQIELTRLMITELAKFPELERILFEEVTLPGRRLLRQALQGGVERGEFGACEADAVVAIIPHMVMGLALGQHVFREVDPAELTPEQLRDVLTRLLIGGIGRTCAGGRPDRLPPCT